MSPRADQTRTVGQETLGIALDIGHMDKPRGRELRVRDRPRGGERGSVTWPRPANQFLRRTRKDCCSLMIWTNLTFSGLDGSACLDRITLLVDLV